MKRYDFYGPESGPGIEEREDGEWVSASVAQSLYDALVVAASSIDPHDKDSFDTVNKALSLADGEE